MKSLAGPACISRRAGFQLKGDIVIRDGDRLFNRESLLRGFGLPISAGGPDFS